MLTATRRALNSATRFAVVRGPTLAAIRGLTRASARLVASHEAVAAVYARGSYARGDFRPFISDIDLAIAVRRPAGGAYDACHALHRRLALARVVNPFVRDVWQTILTEPQWPLVARYGYLFGTGGWRRLTGVDPWQDTGAVDERLLLAAWWNRQHLWTALAVRQALMGRMSLRALGASVKKAADYAALIAGRLDTGPVAPSVPAGEEPSFAAASDALWRLDRSAEALLHYLGPAHGRAGAAGDQPAALEPSPAQRAALERIAEGSGLAGEPVGELVTEGQLVLVVGRALTREEYVRALGAMAAAYRATRVPVAIYSEQAFALAPLLRAMTLLRLPDDASVAATIALGPRLLTEQLVYEAMFLGTHVWVAPAWRDAGQRLLAHLSNGLEYSAHLLTGKLRRERRPFPEMLVQAETLDPELRSRLHALAGYQALLGDRAPTTAELFDLASAVAERLAGHLATRDMRCQPPLLAAAR